MRTNQKHNLYGILILAVVAVIFLSGYKAQNIERLRQRWKEKRGNVSQGGNISGGSQIQCCKITSFEATQVNTHCRGYQLAEYINGRVFFFPYRYSLKKAGVDPYSGGSPSGWFLAHDVSKPFTDVASWQTVDLSSLVDPAAEGFLGGFTDNKHYIYLVPYEKDIGKGKEPSDLFVRYDITKPIDDPKAYETHHLGITNKGWASGVFDGRYAYYCPVNSITNLHTLHGVMVRYDSQKPFDSLDAWKTVDITKHHPQCGGYQSTGFDGRYVYFAPFMTKRLIRYDTTKDFNINTLGAFESVDLTAPKFGGKGAKIYTGVVISPIPGSGTGKYVYFVPWGIPRMKIFVSTVARFDNRKSLNDPAAWEFFDISTLNSNAKGYQFGWYDGKYVYFVATFNGIRRPPFARHDPTKSLNNPDSWSFFDAPASYPASTGAAFDGKFAYTAPWGSQGSRGTVFRLDCSE